MIEYFKNDFLEKTGLVNALYTSNASDVRWKIYSKDDEHICLKYYEELASILGVKINNVVRLHQQHTTNIKIVKKEDGGSGILRKEEDGFYDGSITNEKNMVLCVVSADCIPVFILDPVNKAIGMVHSGWRGTVKKVSIKALDMMKKEYNTDVNDVLIYLGPSICKNCYEVRDDVISEFKMIFNDEEMKKICVVKDNNEDDKKYLLDVSKALQETLLKNGIKKENIMKSFYCTYHDKDLFDSYRRNKQAGHILSCIMLK